MTTTVPQSDAARRRREGARRRGAARRKRERKGRMNSRSARFRVPASHR